MTTYYVGKGGNDTNDGLSWANRFLTLNGAEDEPVAAGDTVYVGPGVYREQLDVDVNGGSSTYITYIGDVTGENTDGIGGPVVITGSNDDQTSTRSYCINGSAKIYRKFVGFTIRGYSNVGLYSINYAGNWIIEDCHFQAGDANDDNAIRIFSTLTNTTKFEIRRCVFEAQVYLDGGAGADSYFVSGSVVENCVFLPMWDSGLNIYGVGNINVYNNLFMGNQYGIYLEDTAANTNTITISGNLFHRCNAGIYQANTYMTYSLSYNNISQDTIAPYTNVTGGVTDEAWGIPWVSRYLLQGHKLLELPIVPAYLSTSDISELGRDSAVTEDLYGRERTITAADGAPGCLIMPNVEREDSTVYESTEASLKITKTGSAQFQVPVVGGQEVTVEVRSYMASGYTGTKPQMIIREPGETDRTTTDTGSTQAWNLLTDTFTLQAETNYITVVLRAENTAATATYFDALEVV